MAPNRLRPTIESGFLAAVLAALCMATAARTQTAPAQWDHDWSRGIVFYRLQVDSFRDANGDGIGDLPGLIGALDSLNDGDPSTPDDLGVDGIVLLSILDPEGSRLAGHTDSGAIDPRLGTNEDFGRLVEQAHARGMRLIIEMPVERCGTPTPPAEIEKSAAGWLATGIDGFLLTAPCRGKKNETRPFDSTTPELAAILARFSSTVLATNPKAVVIGDFPGATAPAASPADSVTAATVNAAATAAADEPDLTLSLDYAIADAIVSGIVDENAGEIVARVSELQTVRRRAASDAPLLLGRDMSQVAARLEKDPAMLRSAASVLLTLPGSPFITCGDEIGLRDGTNGISRLAAGMLAQTGEPASLLSHYRDLIHFRATTQALRTGSIRFLSGAEQGPSVMAFLREAGNRKFLVVHNLGSTPAVAGPFPLPGSYLKRVFEDGRAGDITIDSTQSWRIPMPPHATGIWRVG
jgi:glycosidase